MKKIVTSADLGGAPFTKADLRDVFNDEIWDALEALLAPFNSDTEGLIISGCVFSNNAGNFDMTAGIVYLNGEFMRIAAATNQAYTKYIAPATPTSDSRVFADSTSHAVTQTKTAELVGSAPGAGQYVTINSLTGAEDRRWRSGSVGIREITLDIGDWNMDSTTGVTVTAPAGILAGNVRGITSVSIRPDTGVAVQVYYSLLMGSTNTLQGGYSWGIATPTDPAAFSLFRLAAGFFDATDFDATGFNRGTISFLYQG